MSPLACRRSLVALLLGLLLPAVAGGEASAQPGPEARREALVEDLEELVAWCRKKRLFGKRDETWALVLAIDPEHVAARAALDFHRDEDGAWVQDEGFKPGTNWSRSALGDYEDRRRAVLATWRDAAVAAARQTGAEDALLAARAAELARVLEHLPADEAARAARRDVLLARHRLLAEREGAALALREVEAELRSGWPEDALVRQAVGDVRCEEGWVLEETVWARDRREALSAAAREALEAVGEPREATLDAIEANVAIAWAPGYETDHARVVGVADAEGLAVAARNVEAMGDLMEAALGAPIERPAPFVVHVFAARDAGDLYLHALDLPEAWLERVLAQGLKGFSVGSARYVLLGVDTQPTQVEMATLAACDATLQTTFGSPPGGGSMRGWIYEGVSRYLTWRLTGLRLSRTVDGRYAGAAGAAAPGEGWLERARAVAAAGDAPSMRLLLGKRVEGMTGSDGLFAYAFAAWLIEGRPQAARALIAGAIQEKAPPAALCRAYLGLSPEAVDLRLARWLEEMAASPATLER